MHTPDASFGARLRKARNARGMSQSALADGLTTSSFLSLVESGKRSPGPRLATALAERLGIPVDIAAAEVAPAGYILGMAAVRAGDTATALQCIRDLADGPQRLLLQALVDEQRGDLTAAAVALQDAIRAASGNALLELEVGVALCRVAYNAGNLAVAIDVGEAALAANPDPVGRTAEYLLELRATLSGIYCDTGNIARARELVHVTADDASPDGRGRQLWARAIVAMHSGDRDAAGTYATDALRVFNSADQPLAYARLQVTAAMLQRQAAQSDDREAISLLKAAEHTFRALGARLDLAGCLVARAHLEVSTDPRAARVNAGEALFVIADEASGVRARIFAAAALVFLALGDREAALVHLRDARSLLESAGADRAAATVWRQLATAHEELGQLDLAVACLKAATELLGVHAQHSPQTVV